MKKCPKCGTGLEEKVMGTLDVDECTECKGIQSDKGEMEKAEELADPNINWIDFDIWKHQDKFDSLETDLKCPVCGNGLTSIVYGDTGVRVDHCSECDGIWLDRDEFPKIIESLEDELATKTFSEYLHESVGEAKELVTGHKPFSEEWKDFSTVLKLMQYRLFVEKPDLIKTLTNLNTLNPFK